MVSLIEKKLKPGRFVQVRSGEFYRLTTIGDIIVMETRIVDVAVEEFYDTNLKAKNRKNYQWDIIKVCNDAYIRYGSAFAGGSRLYYTTR